MLEHDAALPPREALDHSVEKIASSTLPVERNVSEAFDRLEVGRVWHKAWQVAC